MQYFGDDITYYQTKNTTNELDVPLFWYELSEGENGDWAGFVELLNFFSSSTDAEFSSSIADRVELSSLLRMMIVESFMLATDNLAGGGNYYAYHRTSSPKKWQIIECKKEKVLPLAR